MSSTAAHSKRPADDVSHYLQPAIKQNRLEPADTYSDSAKKKHPGSSRTGQACDRCKVRKIRCDARPGGCSPCAQNNTECRTTDRITGRATSRGHTENLENENTNLRLYMVELQAQLREHGIEPRTGPVSSGALPLHTVTTPARPPPSRATTQESKDGERTSAPASSLPDYREGGMGDNYLGMASENSMLGPIEGTSLSLFGTKINVADFIPPDADVDADAMSYSTFLAYAFGRRPPPPVPQLPEEQSCTVFAGWFFKSVLPMVPILHRPDFMALLHRIYQENYQPSPAETAMVHMMLCMMNYQWSARNKSEQARLHSFQHYHYALSFVPRLLESHQLPDMQALALICMHLRCQPRTGAAWWFTDLVLGLAIESGLHRSAKAWQTTKLTPHEIEIRKRVFWALITLQTGMGVKLGRPIRLRTTDFDIELPEPEHDALPGEQVSKWRKCSFRSGLEGYRLMQTQIALVSTIYSVRSVGASYEAQVQQLETDLEAFEQSLPPELSLGEQQCEEDRINALYIRFNMSEAKLLLHHPATCRSTSAETTARNLDICLEAATILLNTAVELKQWKSLDTTWYYTMTWLAAISTTLFAHHERRDSLSSADIQKLRQDMDSWIDVMGEVGSILGTGPRLRNAVNTMIDTSFNKTSAHVAAKTALAAVTKAASSTPEPKQHKKSPHHTTPNKSSQQPKSVAQSGQYPVDVIGATTQQAYTQNTHYTYQSTSNPAVYGQGGSFGNVSYSTEDVKPNLTQLMPTEYQDTPNSYMVAYPPQQQQQQQQQPNAYMNQSFQQPTAWRDFTDNMFPNMNGNYDYTNSSNAYLQFANSTRPGDISGMDITAALPIQLGSGEESLQTWPLIQYHSGQSGV